MRAIIRIAVLVTVALSVPSHPALAQGRHNLLVTLTGGIGGSIDEDDAGLGNRAFQLGLAMESGVQRLLSLRLGRISFGSEEVLGALADPQLDYAIVGGEYRFDEGAYISGLFLGLGAYRLEGIRAVAGAAGVRDEKTVLGVNLGASGLFEVTRRVSLTGEISAHLLNSDVAEIFLVALGGVAIHI